MSIRIMVGDVREQLRHLPDGSVHCCVSSPPYFGLRSYLPDGHPDKAKEIGLEPTPDAYVAEMVAVFREVRRVLRPDGTLWLNLGDSYNTKNHRRDASTYVDGGKSQLHAAEANNQASRRFDCALKEKDLVGIPWRVAFALQADGWWLRSDIIWAKPNPMPESVRDRPTKAHEYLFLLSKSERYHYDAEAIAEAAAPETAERYAAGYKNWGKGQFLGSPTDKRGPKDIPAEKLADRAATRNARSVWTIATQPFAEAHFATFPPELAERCIKAGCPKGGTVLDPFAGAGTTLLVADRLGCDAIGIELNPTYAEMAERRVVSDAPLFAEVAA